MKIKIIDLLNKIYNNDNIPKKIIYRNCNWEYREAYNDFIDEYGNYLLGLYIHDYEDTYEFLNSESEIIEEDKKIEKIDIDKMLQTKKWKRDKNAWKKINEIIDVVNKLEGD